MPRPELPLSVTGGCLCGGVRYTITFPENAEWPPQGVQYPRSYWNSDNNNNYRIPHANAQCAANLPAVPFHSASLSQQAIYPLPYPRTRRTKPTTPPRPHTGLFAIIADPAWHSPMMLVPRSQRYISGLWTRMRSAGRKWGKRKMENVLRETGLALDMICSKHRIIYG